MLAVLTLVLGAILGAILGVSGDRLWRRLEEMVRVDVKGGYFENIDGEQGISFSIKNRGSNTIPEYRICLFHPQRGSLFVFRSKEPAPLLPDQEDQHECAMLRHGEPSEFIAGWFFHVENEPVSDVDSTGFSLQLIMRKSKKVLWESEVLGTALATQFVQVINEKSFQGGILPEVLELYTSGRKPLLKWIKGLCWRRSA